MDADAVADAVADADPDPDTGALKLTKIYKKLLPAFQKDLVCLNSHEIAILNSVGQPTFPHLATAT
jgi:hypothetical protein